MGISVQLTHPLLTFFTVKGPPKLRLPLLSTEHWFKLFKPGSLNCLTTPEMALSSWWSVWVSVCDIIHLPHFHYAFIHQYPRELVLCLGSCDTCFSDYESADIWCITSVITHVQTCTHIHLHTQWQNSWIVNSSSTLFGIFLGKSSHCPLIVFFSPNLSPFILREYTFWGKVMGLGIT